MLKIIAKINNQHGKINYSNIYSNTFRKQEGCVNVILFSIYIFIDSIFIRLYHLQFNLPLSSLYIIYCHAVFFN